MSVASACSVGAPRNASRSIAPVATACDTPCSVAAFAFVRPIVRNVSAPAAASVAGDGKPNSGNWPSTGSSAVPNARTRRSVIVLAPTTLTCWPSIARIMPSNGSSSCGRRRNGRAFTSGLRRTSFFASFANAPRSAVRSNDRSTIARISSAGSAGRVRARIALVEASCCRSSSTCAPVA